MTDKRATLLIVDDAPDNVFVLHGILRNDYKIKAASSGAEALKLVRYLPRPDLILLDIMMPGMDGYEVCQQLKSDPATAAIPVIFVTAKDDESDEAHGFSVGGADYITKPVKPSVVTPIVHAASA